MASPPQQIYMDFDRFDNFSNACYYMGNIEVSEIGEWILQDNSRKKFTDSYFYMLKNFTGEFTGENPKSVVYGFLPHLLLVLVLTSTLSHSLHLFLCRLKQPLIISQIIVVFLMYLPWTNGGHGDRNDQNLFVLPPKRHLETAIGFIALTFKAFVYAFKTDISMMWRIGKKPIIIGLASLVIPLMSALIMSYVLYSSIHSFVMHKEKFILFLAALYSHSPFIVLSDILSEFGLLSSELGRLTLSSSMVQSTTGLVLLGLFGIVNQGQHSGAILFLITIAINLFIVAFVVFIVRPYGRWIVQDTQSKGYVREVHMFTITITILFLAMLSDIAGAVFFFGPIMMGFALPNGSALGTALVDRIEVVGQELLVPVYFIVVGRNMDWEEAFQQSRLWTALGLIILIICLAKFATVVIAAYCCDMSLKNGMLLGLIMNFKGFFEILVLMYLHYGQVLDSGALTMMTFSILIITSICAPLVSLFYKPLNLERNNSSGHTVRNAYTHTELRVLSYFFDEKPIPTLLDFLECLTSQEIPSYTSIYSLHLSHLNARVASSLINHRNKSGQINMKQMELVHKHFISFGQEKIENVTVLPFTSIAPQQNMYQDICAFIIERNIDLVIIPFPRKNSSMACLNTNHSTWSLVPKVLEQARSSVGIMVYHCIQQITLVSRSYWQYHIGVVFFGGPDDREGIAIASRMASHQKVHINLLRFCTYNMIKTQKMKIEDSHDVEEALDHQVIDDLQRENINNNRLVVSEVTTTDVEKIIFTLQTFGDKYDLVIVGRRRGNSSSIISLALEEGIESRELGVIGDMLASSKYENPANILVVQNHAYV